MWSEFMCVSHVILTGFQMLPPCWTHSAGLLKVGAVEVGAVEVGAVEVGAVEVGAVASFQCCPIRL
jgi:hypothetical protein